jgi:uncharacterized membrane protein
MMMMMMMVMMMVVMVTMLHTLERIVGRQQGEERVGTTQ